MEAYCKATIEQIKSAKDESELIQVVGNSLKILRKSRIADEQNYITNMIDSLRTISMLDFPDQIRSNVNFTLAVFRQFQKGNQRHTK